MSEFSENYCSDCGRSPCAGGNCPGAPDDEQMIEAEDTLGYRIQEEHGDRLLKCWHCNATNRVADWIDNSDDESHNLEHEATLICPRQYCPGAYDFTPESLKEWDK